MFRIKFAYYLLAATLFLVASCRPDEEELPAAEFDRSAMLQNYGDNVILPNYERLSQSLDTLSNLKDVFIASPTQLNLDNLRQGLKNSWINWMYCSSFEIGPASTVLLRQTINTFPADTTQINLNISLGTYTFGSAANIDAAGFPTLDFLLFGTGANDTEILNAFTIDSDFTNRKIYLNDVVEYIESNLDGVYNSWISSGGNYISTFKNATGTDVGSSTGMLVNDLNFDYENLKNFRIGIPLGKQTLDIPLPEKVEVLYGKYASELSRHSIRNIENIYLGRSRSGNDGQGLDDYLAFINANYNGGSLHDALKSRLADVRMALDAIPNDLGDAVVNNSTPVNDAYLKIVQALVLLKTDMPSSLGILITYQDNDGD
jgi:predicted lipoprotein